MKPGKHLRTLVQSVWGIVSNGYVKGWMPGPPPIYQGKLKGLCVPGMNCYSCPGALGACPIGALQATLSGRQRQFPFYVVGYLATIGLLVGRFICGWLCLFGLIQELLYKIPTPKLTVPARLDRILRRLKYGVLGILVVALPLLYRSKMGMGLPFFCAYLCPVGTLEAGVPLVLLHNTMRTATGWLFRWKFVLLLLCLLTSVFVYRPFCKYVCPLGAFYALFQKVSLLRMRYDERSCVSCGMCAKTCPMGVDPTKNPNGTECIRCGACIHACPVQALSFGMGAGQPGREGDPVTVHLNHPS